MTECITLYDASQRLAIVSTILFIITSTS